MAVVALGAVAIAPAAALAANPCTHTALSWWNATDSDSRSITPPGGKAANINARFTAKWSKDTFDPITICYSVAGTSHAYWFGSSPINAKSVKLTDQWHMDGIGITLGFPASAGFSASGTTISWTTSVSNNWHNDHDFVNIWFKTIIPTGQWEQATGALTFGASSYNIVAYDHS
jgi:hypothetical protein